MPTGDPNKNFRMGPWLVQPDLNRLSDGDRVVTLEPRVMGVLVCLARQPGKIVSADQLLDTVWHGRAHADNTVYQAATQLRKALGDDIHHPRYIETIPKKGYRLICPVTPLAADTEVPEFTSHSLRGWILRRRHLTVFAGIASITVAIILTVNPEFRGWLSSTDDGPADRSVAVLPFVDMSEDGNQQYLADGVAEELIHVLSNLPDLRVTARTSSFAFRDSNEDIRQIGSKLNVATILEGSVRIDGDRLRVTAQLVNSRDGYHLWSQTFDRRTTDLFSIQNEIAVAVARTFEYQELDALAADVRAVRADELETYELYLLGLNYLHKKTQSNYLLAIEFFERVIEMDPSFARAYAGLAVSYASRSRYKNDLEMLSDAESAAEYALSLDDQSVEAFAALGRVKMIKRDYAGAEVAFLKTIELNPNDARAYKILAEIYNRTGRNDEAFVMIQKALELNPMSGEVNAMMGIVENTRTGWDSAFKYFKRGMQRDPDDYHSYWPVGLQYRWKGERDRASPYARKAVDLTNSQTAISPSVGFLTSLYLDIGNYESAAKLIRRMREIDPDYWAANHNEILLQLGHRNFSAARDLVHSIMSTNIGENWLAFYEMVIGDTDHAEEIYAYLAAVPESPDMWGDVNLYGEGALNWGMLGAVNLAYLHTRNGESLAAQELLRKAREFLNSRSDPWYRFVHTIPYVLAQIAAVEGNNDAAIEYFRKAVDAGWTKAWFGRIDPIMTDLRKDARYLQILEELEDRLLEMRDHPKTLASD